MTAIDAPKQMTFRIDMLWSDSRYRSSFLQIIALFITITALFLIVVNVKENLAALGKTFGFGFMAEPASYDINQSLLEYTSRDSHARAAVIGIMNTLLVAVVGCFLATVIGILAGVARLSRNWMLRNLMAVYVEGVRNIPVLIQILLVSALITEVAPAPRAFRGEEGASMWLYDSVAATNRGFYFPMPVMGDNSWLVVVALIVGVVGAVVFGRFAKSHQQSTGEEAPAWAQYPAYLGGALGGLMVAAVTFAAADGLLSALIPFEAGLLVDGLALAAALAAAAAVGWLLSSATVFATKLALIVGLPVLAFFLTGMSISLEYPELGGFNFRGGLYARESYVSLTLALAIYTGAFIAENVRAGIQAVNKGQTEASSALGLQPARTMSLVVLPQALRIIIPPMISQFLNLTKNSSLALLVGYMDVTGTLMGITLNQTGREFETLFLGMAVYLTISLTIAAIMNLYNENTKLVERTSSFGAGISVRAFFDGMTGPWERLNKGDAKMRPDYGLRLELNLYWLFYGLWLATLINYVFITGASDARMTYWDWSTVKQLAAMGMLVTAFAAFVTCLFKNARFIDFVAIEFLLFVMAVLLAFPFGDLLGVSGTLVVLVSGAMRLAIFGYTLFGRRPNLTFFQRIPKAAAEAAAKTA